MDLEESWEIEKSLLYVTKLLILLQRHHEKLWVEYHYVNINLFTLKENYFQNIMLSNCNVF